MIRGERPFLKEDSEQGSMEVVPSTGSPGRHPEGSDVRLEPQMGVIQAQEGKGQSIAKTCLDF